MSAKLVIVYGGLSVSCRAPEFVESRTESLASVRTPQSRVCWGHHSSSVSPAVPGKARMATAGAEFNARGETKWPAATTGWPLPAVVCSSASAPLCLAATREAGCLCRARHSLHLFPFALQQELLNSFEFWFSLVVVRRLRLFPVPTLHGLQGD